MLLNRITVRFVESDLITILMIIILMIYFLYATEWQLNSI